MEIRCEELISGEICYGNLILTEKAKCLELTVEEISKKLGYEVKIVKS